MGMYDTITCDYPLPGGEKIQSEAFQTKDLECSMSEYKISSDGRLLQTAGGFLSDALESAVTLDDFHGDLDFYTSNFAACGHGYIATSDDTPPWSANYTARFDAGRLREIVGGISPSDAHSKHVSRADFERLRKEADAAEAAAPAPYTVTLCGVEYELRECCGSFAYRDLDVPIWCKQLCGEWRADVTFHGLEASGTGDSPQAAVTAVESKLRSHYDKLKGLLYPGE